MRKTYLCFHAGRQIEVEAQIGATAQTIAARKFGIRQSLAQLIIVRSQGYNRHGDRYTQAGAQA